MPEQAKIFTVQPRFKIGDYPAGWALVDGIFQFGDTVPAYGTEFRDAYLALAWFGEPMIAGVFSTWIEKAQTVNWKVTGGRNSANYYARLFNQADNGAGWTYHEGVCGMDYLTTDKGSFEELGRDSLTPEMIDTLQQAYEHIRMNREGDVSLASIDAIINQAVSGRVTDIQHIDSTRLIRVGLPGMRWRYFPDGKYPVIIPDLNIVQITSMPSARDRWAGFGHCALTRLLDAKQLMLGYLTYYRQEIGNLPPELVAIINGLPETTVMDSFANYKRARENKGLDTYGKIWWLGSDDPMTPVSLDITSLVTPNKSFNYQTMIEWWAKLLALNTGEDVGEYWLLQSGESKTVQSIQAMKSEGKGVARYLSEKERKYNTEITPYGTLFEYDNPYDEADNTRADILAKNITSLAAMAGIGVDRQEPAYTIEEIRRLGVEWDVTPLDFNSDEAPAVFGAVLKSLYDENTWIVDRNLQERQIQPLLKGKEARQAEFTYKALKEAYTANGHMKHKSITEYQPIL